MFSIEDLAGQDCDSRLEAEVRSGTIKYRVKVSFSIEELAGQDCESRHEAELRSGISLLVL